MGQKRSTNVYYVESKLRQKNVSLPFPYHARSYLSTLRMLKNSIIMKINDIEQIQKRKVAPYFFSF